MYFEDLSHYRYGRTAFNPNMVNIGWLSIEHPLQTGITSEGFIEQLKLLVANPVNEYRGIHYCEFCPPPLTRTTENGLRIAEPSPGTFGNGEVRIQGIGQIVYAAPVLVLHYVTVHGYLPPLQFIRAVEALASNRDPTSGSTRRPVKPAAR